MNTFLRVAFAVAGFAIVWLGGSQSAKAQSTQPLYNNLAPAEKLNPLRFMQTLDGTPLSALDIDLANVPPAKSVDEANNSFSARAAAAILYGANLDISKGGFKQEEDYGVRILAKMAYADYFSGPDQVPGRIGPPVSGGSPSTLREEVIASLRRKSEIAGRVGSSIHDFGINIDGEYDVLLTAYIMLYYKYYSVLPQDVRDKLLHQLLTQSGPYLLEQNTSFSAAAPPLFAKVTIPETENHLLMIESARYLTNQLLYREGDGTGQTHQLQYDNNRNDVRISGGGHLGPMVDWILLTLQGFLKNDFVEYNSRNYQDYTMVALLNLYNYSYDNRVKMAAGMVLDYLSAKMAVSSNDLRRAVPYRRHNTIEDWGPCVDPPNCVFLNTPLVKRATDNSDDVDPQIAFYSMLAGNTAMLADHAPPHYTWGMVRAGLSDYRIPPLILDLFVNRGHRRFYQIFKHLALPDARGYAVEVYAGSPSYLISAGGNPTVHAYESTITAGIFSGTRGKDDDLGFAFPTTFIPTGTGTTLGQLVQFQTDSEHRLNLCVGIDFACGEFTYLPSDFRNRHEPPPNDHWTFIDKSNQDPTQPGYFLAIYQSGGANGGSGLLEAYDTLAGGLNFQQFKGLVLSRHGFLVLQGDGARNTYVSLSEDVINFEVSPWSTILSEFLMPTPPHPFAYGTIIKSDEDSAVITISNPARGPQQITLDMHDQDRDGDPLYGIHHPRRLSESGEVIESAGANEEVWVDFNSPRDLPEAGDFYQPFKTLIAAQNAVAVGGTIKIVPGSSNERVRLIKKMTLKSFAGSATISGRQ